MNRISTVTFILGLLVGPGAFAQATTTLPGQNGQLFNNSSVAGSMFNAVTNPMSGALNGYDQCFKDVLRVQTKVYNPFTDPVQKIKDEADKMKKAFETKVKEVGPEPTICKEPAKGEGTDACKKAWKEYRKKKDAYDSKKSEESKEEQKIKKEQDALIASFNFDIPGVEGAEKGKEDKAKNDLLFEKLRTMAMNNGFKFDIELFPNPPSCPKINDKVYFDRLKELIQIQNLAISYQENRLQTLRNATSCLDQNVSAVAQQVQNLASKFQAQYQTHYTMLTTMKAHEDERRRIIDQIILPTILVNGKPDGTGRMTEIRDQINAVLVSDNGIWAKAASIQSALQKLDQDRQNAESFYQADVAATAMSCFNDGSKGAVSNADLQAGKTTGLADQFADLVAATAARTTTVDGQTALLATSRTDKDTNALRVRSTIMNRFNAIFANVPKPTTGTAGSASVSTGFYRTEGAIKAAVNNAFSEYSYLKRNSDGSISGDLVPLAAAVNNEISRCFSMARGSEQNQSEPYIRRKNALTQIDLERKKQVATINTALSDAYKTFVDAANILQLPNRTPEQYGANMADCRNDQNPIGMANCFDAFRGAMNGLANGGPNMASRFIIETRYITPVPPVAGMGALGVSGKASMPLAPVIAISCSGLNDCARQINLKRAAFETDIVDIKNDRKKYAAAATQQMQTMGMQLMNQGNPQFGQPSLQQSTNDLMAKINLIQDELRSVYGVTVGGQIPIIPPANWTPITGDDNPLAGFIERPQDPISAVAAGAIDFRNNPFKDLAAATGEGEGSAGKSINEKRKKISEYQTKLSEAQKTCSKEAADALEKLKSTLTNEEGCLLLSGAEQLDTSKTEINPDLQAIANFFKGEKGNNLNETKINGVLGRKKGCQTLMDAGIKPIYNNDIGQIGLISASDLSDICHTDLKKCHDNDKNGAKSCEIDYVEWHGNKIDPSLYSKLVPQDGSAPTCGAFLDKATKALETCSEVVKSSSWDNCGTTSMDLRKKAQDVLDAHPKATQTPGASVKSGI